MAKLIKKEVGVRQYGLTGQEHYTACSIQTRFGYSFFQNLIGGNQLLKNHRKELAERLKNLRSNGYRFVKKYCGRFSNPVDFARFVSENNYTFENAYAVYEGGNLNRLQFAGNLKELSHCFDFLIYDLDYFFNEVKPLLPTDFKIEHWS